MNAYRNPWHVHRRTTHVAIVDHRGHTIFCRRHNNLNQAANLARAVHVVALHNAWLAAQGAPAPPAAGSP